MCRLLLSTCVLFFRPSCPSVSILCRSGAVFWDSCPLSAVVPGSLITLWYLPLRRLVTGPVWSQGFLYLSTLGPQCPSVVVRRLPSVRRSSFGYGPPRSLSLLRLFGPCLGALLLAPSSFSTCGLLSARPFGLSPSPLGFSFLFSTVGW